MNDILPPHFIIKANGLHTTLAGAVSYIDTTALKNSLHLQNRKPRKTKRRQKNKKTSRFNSGSSFSGWCLPSSIHLLHNLMYILLKPENVRNPSCLLLNQPICFQLSAVPSRYLTTATSLYKGKLKKRK